MRGCSVHYHETLDLTDSVDTKLIDPPRAPLRSYEEGIDELVSSIREKGLIQPIIVRPTGDRFEVVAGARRLEGCKVLRWSRVPCIIRDMSDQEAYEMSLTENVQRRTMNAVEEAEAFRKYIEKHGWGSESQLARKLGKSQEYISQRLSLLALSKSAQDKIIRRLINPSVAQEIARLEDPMAQEELLKQVVRHHLTVGIVRESTKSIKRGESVEDATRRAGFRRRGETNEMLTLRDELSEPEFMKAGIGDVSKASYAVRDLEKAALILKLAVSRLGSLIDTLPEDSPIKDMLLEKRLLIHNMIDSLIKSKIKIGGRIDLPISGT